MAEKLPRLEPDGLPTPNVGAWGERKYRLVSNYAAMFARSMKLKWECRVYIDLFAGSGRAQLEGTSRIVPGSPLLALMNSERFDRYVFCETDPGKMAALRKRAVDVAPEVTPTFIDGDANEAVGDILAALPRPRSGYRVLGFCFVDPYNIGNLRFETIRRLSERYMDFLVLIPSYMDANRNRAIYVQEENLAVERFLGRPEWREQWAAAEKTKQDFGAFVANAFGEEMAKREFLYESLADMEQIRSRNRPLYHLGFFSRHELGAKFWRQARKYSVDQTGFPFMEE